MNPKSPLPPKAQVARHYLEARDPAGSKSRQEPVFTGNSVSYDRKSKYVLDGEVSRDKLSGRTAATPRFPTTKKRVGRSLSRSSGHQDSRGRLVVRLPDCPICAEALDATDFSFSPCSCGFKLCLLLSPYYQGEEWALSWMQEVVRKFSVSCRSKMPAHPSWESNLFI
ncbi:hypothetical protein R1flu_004957 [Riccia fluitans]|uniref:Uncharacterized protein n=1 Tax=Riccia fluitans TaxID=41844 RepID=A0ABD1YS41_9MARC